MGIPRQIKDLRVNMVNGIVRTRGLLMERVAWFVFKVPSRNAISQGIRRGTGQMPPPQFPADSRKPGNARDRMKKTPRAEDDESPLDPSPAALRSFVAW